MTPNTTRRATALNALNALNVKNADHADAAVARTTGRSRMATALRRTLPALAAIALAAPLAALASGEGGSPMPAKIYKPYAEECAACHVAYPPSLLSAQSWRRIMNDLPHHYGTDASLDPQTVKAIGVWLEAHAGNRWRIRNDPPEDRITRTTWFERKHRHIDESVWRLASVRSKANCAACHTSADVGIFDDDGLKFPAGMTARQRRSFDD